MFRSMYIGCDSSKETVAMSDAPPKSGRASTSTVRNMFTGNSTVVVDVRCVVHWYVSVVISSAMYVPVET
ncbi:MAG: hypothetical protein A2X31_11520 [Elusimicrobia bacterium GWB2_63_22]|nr:MAG: hypothetical protein A2X31_11520 [Elusimicrobia bacterium GWB2_63_22]